MIWSIEETLNELILFLKKVLDKNKRCNLKR